LTRFSDLVKAFENTPKPRKITADGTPEMVADGVTIRADVFTTHFEDLVKRFEGVKA